jgi:putative sigma-54 modulation protein
MNIQINSMKFAPTSELQSFVTEKVKRLVHYNEEIIGAQVFLKLENTQDIENKVAEIKLELPGNEIFVKKQSKSFEESTDNAIDALKRQIIKYKQKLRKV